MGCGESKPTGDPAVSPVVGDDPVENANATQIDRELDQAKQEDEGKVKLLLLGAGESGKSTIFKQMRILYGSPRSEDDLRMYGVVIRHNIIVAMRKLCVHLKNLGLEDALSQEPAPENGGSSMTPKEAYDKLVAHLVECSASEESLPSVDKNDWVGQSPRAGLAANNDAKQFLQHVDAIRTVWQVSRKS